MEWNVAEAKSKFSELLDRAEREGPQRIQRHGKRFVILVEDSLSEGDNPLVRAFLDEPEFRNLNIERIEAPMRDPEL
ncbi:MAG TPA: type II toxin-antitoxin system prevent-host-death family antitoxin [Thermomicrobiales bacterium]|nr:type II toxin-antitoxin system prevent-host-death family antitoxin [Thermomicrobiales bacterium]